MVRHFFSFFVSVVSGSKTLARVPFTTFLKGSGLHVLLPKGFAQLKAMTDSISKKKSKVFFVYSRVKIKNLLRLSSCPGLVEGPLR
jgi:hypothetical protein